MHQTLQDYHKLMGAFLADTISLKANLNRSGKLEICLGGDM
jgi:hypothetical protein